MNRFSEKQGLVILLACLQFLILSDYLILMPMGPMLMEIFGIQTRAFAGLISAYSIGAIVIALASAGWLDRFDRVRALQIGLIAFLFISAMHGLVRHYSVLLMLRFLAGGAAGLIGSLILSLIAQAFDSSRRGRVIGIVLSATSVCQIVGIPLGLFATASFGWKAPFVIHAMIGSLIMVWLLRMQGRFLSPSGNPSHLGNQVLIIARQPYHFKAMVCTLLVMMSGSLVIPFLPLLLVFRFGVAEGELGGVYLIAGVVAFFASLAAGRLAERGSGRLAIYVIGFLSVFPLVLFATVHTMPQWGVIGVFAVCNALTVARVIPMSRFVMEFVHPSYLGGFQSINTALMHIGASAAAWMAGEFISVTDGTVTGFELAVSASIGSLLLVVILVTFGFTRVKTAKLATGHSFMGLATVNTNSFDSDCPTQE